MGNFKTAMFQANLLYGTEFTDESEFEEIGLIGYQMIGNKNVRYYRFNASVDKNTLSIDLPCNCSNIEAVTIPIEGWNYSDGANPNGDIESLFAESYIQARKKFTDPLYVNGKYIHYERIGNKLYFQHPYPNVLVLYEGEMLDDEGLPELNDDEIQAIAAYAAYVVAFKEGIATNNPNKVAIANALKQEWNKFCDKARVPKHIDQNDMNDILEVKTSWNRKSYGSSYKVNMK